METLEFGRFGGQFVAETLIPALDDLYDFFKRAQGDESFNKNLNELLESYVGRPTPIYYAKNLSLKYDFHLYLKREDLLHTGAHKINNTIGQALLAKHMGKKRIIAETGAGQHGLATATASALLNLECLIYMGEVDGKRQRLNVEKMKLLGADVKFIDKGSKTLKEAVSAALKDYITNIRTTHYIIGSTVGPHPYPEIVMYFQSVIGNEALYYFKEQKFLPHSVVACVGGGSNAAGIFKPFLGEKVELIGVEAGGESSSLGKNAASINYGSPGIFQGAFSYVLQDEFGQIVNTESISAGLDYPGVGPFHSHLKESGRAKYVTANDADALNGFYELIKNEGIIPALESAHALGYVLKNKDEFKGRVVLVNLSGRGDKDLDIVLGGLQ
jgi:tryptophan synthase beta chain